MGVVVRQTVAVRIKLKGGGAYRSGLYGGAGTFTCTRLRRLLPSGIPCDWGVPSNPDSYRFDMVVIWPDSASIRARNQNIDLNIDAQGVLHEYAGWNH